MLQATKICSKVYTNYTCRCLRNQPVEGEKGWYGKGRGVEGWSKGDRGIFV